MLSPNALIRDRYRVVYAVNERPSEQLFRVRDEQTGKLMLLCVLPLADPAQQRNTALLAQQLAAVQHPALLALADHFADNQAYILLCDDPGGQDLGRVLRSSGGTLAEKVVLDNIEPLLDLLDRLHGRVPPLLLGELWLDDVWVNEQGAWRLLPFALVRPITDSVSPYRAPELLAPDAEPTRPSDTYTITAVLYQALAGSPPTAPDQRKADVKLVEPRALNPQVSALAEQALLRGLQLRDVNRYQNARELQRALETVGMMGGRSLGVGPMVAQQAPQTPQASTPIVPVPLPIQAAPVAPPQAQPPSEEPPVVTTYPYPPPQYPPQRRGISTGCLVTLVVVLLLALFAMCLLGLFLFPGSPFYTFRQANTTTSTIAPPGSQPTTGGAVQPVAAGVISLENAREITSTAVITSEMVGPVAYSPDGATLALGIDNVIRVLAVDTGSQQYQIAGHTGAVFALDYSPDGSLLASGARDDNDVRVWDAATGTLRRTLSGHTGWIREVAFSPDGKLLASSSTDTTIRLWDVANGTPVRTLSGHSDWVGGIAFSPDSTALVSASRDGSVRLWDVATGQQRSAFTFQMPTNPTNNQTYWATGIAFSPDGARIAVGSTDNNAYVLNGATGAREQVLSGHTDWIFVRALAFAPDSKTLYTASLDGSVRAWNLANGTELARFESAGFRLAGVALSPDGTRLATTSAEEGVVTIWDVAQQAREKQVRVGLGLITDVAYAPDSTIVSAAGLNGTVRIQQPNTQNGQLFTGAALVSQPLAFLSNNKVVIASDQGSVLSLSDTGSANSALNGLDGRALGVTTSANGAVVAAASSTGALVVWDGATEATKQTLRSALPSIGLLSLNTDGTLLAVSGQPQESQIEIWDAGAGTRLQTIDGATNGVVAMAWQPRSDAVAVIDNAGVVHVWNGRTGAELHTIKPNENQARFNGLAFSPDGSMLVVGTLAGELVFFQTENVVPVTTISVGEYVPVALAFSPDGKQLAASLRGDRLFVAFFEVPKA